MKKLLLMVLIVTMLAGCTTRTEYGTCVGAFDDKDPALVYKLDAWNTVLAIVFFETIFVPVIVVANETLCPVDKKK